MRTVMAALVLCIGSVSMADEYWNQFRGPRGDGTSTEKGLPVTFADGTSAIVWKTPIVGRAWSSPVIWGNQIWITNAPEIQNTTKEKPRLDRPLKLSAVCVDLKTGKILHDLVLFEVDTPQFTHATNSYGSPTPFIEEGRVYIHFGAYGTACLDTNTGKKIWERTDLKCDHFRGPGSSPIVDGDLLFLTFDGYDQQYITALNKLTGETVWKKDRNVDFGTTDGDAKKAYSTPKLIEAGGRRLLISPFASATIAYDPASGTPIWTVHHGGMNAAGRPLYGNGLLYISTADGPNPLVAVPATGEGDITKSIAWRTNKAVPKRPSQLLVGDLLFMMNDSGVASCLDAKTSAEIWTTRLPGEYWASPLYANGLVYCFSQQGHIPVFEAGREFKLVADNKFDEGFVASPAVAGKALILRSKGHLYRVENP
ncbi:MAG: PQQ-binding-like beta-propeller repeat protein [Planctomycetes bacterium]|nr:PQQ-binding-like beta-propeller repeat protein [Planctomycetota bacterium]